MNFCYVWYVLAKECSHVCFQDPVDLGWKPFVQTWLKNLNEDFPENGRQHLKKLIDHSIDRGLNFVRKHNKHLMLPTPDLSIVRTLCQIVTAFFDFLQKNGGFGDEGKNIFARNLRPRMLNSNFSETPKMCRLHFRTKRGRKSQQTVQEETKAVGCCQKTTVPVSSWLISSISPKCRRCFTTQRIWKSDGYSL